MYDAVNGIDRARSRRDAREHAMVSPTNAPANGNRAVAAATAAHAVLVALTPNQRARLDSMLEAELEAAGGAARPGVAAGRDWGQFVGEQVVSLRLDDGTQAGETILACSRFADPVACEPGEFRANFDARRRHMTPFGIEREEPYLSSPPPL